MFLPFLTIGLQSYSFRDVSGKLKLSLANEQACLVDVDQDGWTDIISGGIVWRNIGGTSFVKLSEGVGSVVAADFDNDGFPDLFSWSQMKLYRNEGGLKFVEFPLPTMPPTSSRGACWGDFDNDGFVDLYVGGFEDWDKQITYPSYRIMNKGGKKFELRWSDNEFRTRGVTACDFNRDGAIDIYASNYRLQPNRLWINDGRGEFKDEAKAYNALATSTGFDGGHSIGAAWADFDNDGEFDLFAGNFAHVDDRGDQPKSRFLRNLGSKGGYKFNDLGTCGVFYQESYASPTAGDFDNDGMVDLFFTTVYGTASFGKPNFPVMYHNDSDFKFSDVTKAIGVNDLPPTYQAAFGDVFNKGQLSLCSGGKLFASSPLKQHWLEVRLQGDGKTVNRSAIGAQVRLRLRDKTLSRQVEAGTGEGNQNDLKLHFGLGQFRGKVNLDIVWPGGHKQSVRSVKMDQIVDVKFRG
jgi:hypothetical protein